jgi:hypothetical protein
MNTKKTIATASGKTIVAKFDGGLLSSDGGILVLRDIEQRLRVADRLAGFASSTQSRPLKTLCVGTRGCYRRLSQLLQRGSARLASSQRLAAGSCAPRLKKEAV